MSLNIDLKNLEQLKIHAATDISLYGEIKQQYEDWVQSDFAGFRNILDPSAVEYPDLEQIKNFAQDKQKQMKNFVVLGTGGSSLGAEALIQALAKPFTDTKFFFMDNNDPAWFSDHLEYWQAQETFFYAVSKSGGTAETWSQLLVAIDWIKQSKLKIKDHFAFCTNPEETDFRKFAQKIEAPCFTVPSSVGGRFSVLTPVGLLPAAFAGIDITRLLKGASDLVDKWEVLELEKNPCFQLANTLAKDPDHPITIMLPYCSQLRSFSRWFCQLWAESLGKEEKGLTPYPALGTTDQHSQIQLYMDGPRDKVICFVEVQNPKAELAIPKLEEAADIAAAELLMGKSMAKLFQSEYKATRDALTENKIPNFTISLSSLNEESIGALLYFWEWVTVYAGAILKVNPFDQPGVEKGKILTKEYLNK